MDLKTYGDAKLGELFNNSNSVISALNSAVNEINSANKAAASAQNKFQEVQAAKTMDFNASQAQLNRDWQEEMSSTAHQREVADLQAAGLNPVLSANAGAATGSGASASTSAQSGAKADVSDAIINAISSIKQNEFNNTTQLKMNSDNLKNAYSIAKLQSDTTKYAADRGYEGSVLGASATQAAAALGLQGAKYSADMTHQNALLDPSKMLIDMFTNPDQIGVILNKYKDIFGNSNSGKTAYDAIVKWFNAGASKARAKELSQNIAKNKGQWLSTTTY